MMPNVQDLQHKVDHAEHLKRITAQIHAASHLDHILLDLHKDILSVFDAQDLTLFAFDSEKKEIFSKVLQVDGVQEVRIPISEQSLAGFCAKYLRPVNIADAYTEVGFDFSGTRQFDQKTGYRSKSFLTVPMRNHEGAIIGVLQLINCQDPVSAEIVAFSHSDQRLAESLASQAAIALTNRMLINQLEQLFESFIQLINVAIDEKSPHTGGHCQRVPMLTTSVRALEKSDPRARTSWASNSALRRMRIFCISLAALYSWFSRRSP